MSDKDMRQKGLKITGAPSLEELHNAKEYQLPEAGRPIPLAVIECIEGIPWNPFETACPQHAITVGEEITVLPVVDMELCNGCGICVAACPGLAIYLKQRTYAEGLSYIAFPYEYVPLPEKGQEVEMVDRYGSPDCAGAVIRIITSRKNDRTAVIHACYPEEYFETVVNMKRLG